MKKISLLIIISILFSCKQNPKTKQYYFQGEALGTTYHIKAISNKQSEIVSKKDIDSVINAVNQSLSTYIPSSLISRINKGEKLKADKQFTDVFNAASKIYKATNGLYDPTIGILVNAWGFGPKKKLKNIEKDSVLVDSLLKFVGYNMVSIDSNGFINKKYPQIYFDYNSIAKGYAIDRVAKMLRDKHFTDFLVEIGGEVVAGGKNSLKNRAWIVAVDNPERATQKKYISEIKLKDKAMATSGNYRKFYVDKKTGRKYVHTINPKTGYPAISHLLSATLIAKNCTIADGYATACMVLGLEKSKKLLKNNKDLEAFLVYSDKNGNIKTFHTEGIEFIK